MARLCSTPLRIHPSPMSRRLRMSAPGFPALRRHSRLIQSGAYSASPTLQRLDAVPDRGGAAERALCRPTLQTRLTRSSRTPATSPT